MSGTYKMVTVPQYELDELREQRSALLAHRAALVEACEAQQRALDILHAVIKSNGGFLTVAKRVVYQGALIRTQAALALVKGGTSE